MNIRSIARKPFFDTFYMYPHMPGALRIALSDGLTYIKDKEHSGAHGHFRFNKFQKLSPNKGLNKAYKAIIENKDYGNHITENLSHADLIQLAGAAAVEYCGGPFIDLKIGREDVEDEHNLLEHTAMPHPDMNIKEIKEKFHQIGLKDDLIVAMFGYRTLGFLSNKEAHKEERWTRNPWVFNNNYFVELLDKHSPYLKTPSDKALLEDSSMLSHIEAYSQDENLFFDKFTQFYQFMSELGCDNLLGENLDYLKH